MPPLPKEVEEISQTPIEVEEINVPNFDLNRAMNILFLAEGFTSRDRWYFDEVTDYLAKKFVSIRPFCIKSFKNRINFFRAFGASTDSGVTFNGEVDQSGLPLPTQETSDSGGDEIPAPDKRFKMKSKNTLFGVTLEPDIDGGAIVSPCDATVRKIDRFIRRLTYRSDPLVPDIWREQIGTGTSPGKDSGLVVVIINENVGRTVAPGRVYMVLETHTLFNLTSINTSFGTCDHVPPMAATDIDKFTFVNTMIHEFGHSYYGLDDEYADLPADKQGGGSTVNNCVRETDAFRPKLDDAGRVMRDAANRFIKVLDPQIIPWNRPLYDNCTLLEKNFILSKVLEIMQESAAPLFRDPDPHPDGTAVSGPNNDKLLAWIEDRKRVGIIINHPEELVGLYEQAAREFRGFFRPAGICKMRQSETNDFFGGFDFCTVCMNIITEKTAKALGVDLTRALYQAMEFDYAYKIGLRGEVPGDWDGQDHMWDEPPGNWDV